MASLLRTSDVTSANAAAIFAVSGVAAVEVLVIQSLDRGLEDTAVALGMRLQETRDSDAAATELREFVSSLFQSEVDVSPHDRAVEGRFFDEIVFTRQIPIEFSPIEKWSLAELWTRASGLTGGTSGIDPTHMGRWN